jgi:hypothetical protein
LQLAGDEFALHFDRAAMDAVDTVVDEGARHWVLEHAAIATVELDHGVQCAAQ